MRHFLTDPANVADAICEARGGGFKVSKQKTTNDPEEKSFPAREGRISELRSRGLRSRRIQSEPQRLHDLCLSRTTIEKILEHLQAKPLYRPRLVRKGWHRYFKEIPEKRVQVDVCKIVPGLYQYTAVDDCTHIRVLGLFRRRTTANSLCFLEKLIEEMPFPVQTIQTDRGREFFAYNFQEKLMDYPIKFRPIQPASPHLNGKVERSQRTDLEEFYPTVDLADPNLHQKLELWQDYNNQERPHSSLGGQTP